MRSPQEQRGDTASGGGLFGVPADAADMVAMNCGNDPHTIPSRQINSHLAGVSSSNMPESPPAIDHSGTAFASRGVRLCRRINPRSLNSLNIIRDVLHSVGIVPGEIRLDERIHQLLGLRIWGAGGLKDPTAYMAKMFRRD